MSTPPKDTAAADDKGESTSLPEDLSSLRAPSFREPLPPMDHESILRLDFLAPAAKPDELGRLGSYGVLKVLGLGGMGAVLLAEDLVLKRQVAVKVMRPELAADSTIRRRFLREAQAAAALDHRHIVPIHHVGEENGVPFIVMPLLKGEPLDNLLKREKRLPIAAAVTIGKQIADGLAEAHKNGVIHRDIKPANIWLSGEPGPEKGSDPLKSQGLTPFPAAIVRIADFGLAAVAGDDAQLTKTGTILGTPAYMAPEQARREKVDVRSDLFSLGAVLYRMLTGDLPFKGRDTMSMLLSLAADTPAPVQSLNPEVSPALADLVMQLLAKEPTRRPPSAQAVAEALGEIGGDKTMLLGVIRPHPASTKETGLRAILLLVGRWSGRLLGSLRPRAFRHPWLAFAVEAVLLAILAVMLSLPLLTHGHDGASGSFSPGPEATASRQGERPQDKGPPKEFINSLQMKFMLIPAGKFTMGSSQQEIDRAKSLWAIDPSWVGVFEAEGPEHEVEITRPFYMGATEVTVGQFRLFVTEKRYQVGDSHWADPGFTQSDDNAVGWLTWRNAVNFCTWLSQREGKTYRLPTEAEWEYSCRAGKAGLRFCFGNNDIDLSFYAWYQPNSEGRAHPVGMLTDNEWGLFDMHGNIWEWCQDNYDANYYKVSPKQDPAGPPSGRERVLRGGAWRTFVPHCRSAFRYHFDPAGRNDYFGFRVVCEVARR